MPSVTGSSSHATGIGLSAILFGPWVSVVLAGIVLLFQTSFLALTQGIPFPNEFLGWIRAFFFSLHENFLADFLFTILTQILWFFGIHGEYVLYNFAGTYLEFLNMDIFTDSMAAGSVLTPSMAMLDHVFVNIGGPGALLPLLFAIFISFLANRNNFFFICN